MFDRFAADRRGNTAIIFGLAAIPLIFALGASVDYGIATRSQARLNAMADAATLSAVTPMAMQQSTAWSQIASGRFFATQAATVPKIVNLVPNLQITETTSGGQRTRTATLTYTTQYSTAFSKILQMPFINLAGRSVASASTSPNIDFYLMLDTSPSMGIPATTSGINWMVAQTPYQGGGCAFACHETNPSAESNGGTPQNPVFGNQGCPDDPQNRPGPCIDNYAIARAGNIVLRTDLVTQAVQNLIGTAQSTSTQTGAAYRLAAYTFDASVNLPMPLQPPSSAAQQQAGQISMLEVQSNNMLNGQVNNDEDTGFDAAFSRVTTDMNSAGVGTGSNAVGDKPQQVLMIVTDGVSDQAQGSTRIYTPLGAQTNMSSGINSWCTNTTGNPNRRIAILYLTYNPLPSNSWYTTYIAPEQSQIAPILQQCASPGLFFQVNTDGDVSSAMNTLFQNAVHTAHLTN